MLDVQLYLPRILPLSEVCADRAEFELNAFESPEWRNNDVVISNRKENGTLEEAEVEKVWRYEGLVEDMSERGMLVEEVDKTLV